MRHGSVSESAGMAIASQDALHVAGRSKLRGEARLGEAVSVMDEQRSHDGRGEPRWSTAAQRAYADYRDMGSHRSLEKLAEEYRASTEAVPTRQLSRLKKWSAAFGWQERLLAEETRRDALKRQAADDAVAAAAA